MGGDDKEWVRVAHSATGLTTVTVSLLEDNLSVRWSVKTYPSALKSGIAEARKYARKAMVDLREALAALDAEAAA